MKEKGARYLLVLSISMMVACLLQIYGTIRYVRRLPDDTFGVVLYVITSILFAILATVNYIRWTQAKKGGASRG